jgi:hypothetical protein
MVIEPNPSSEPSVHSSVLERAISAVGRSISKMDNLIKFEVVPTGLEQSPRQEELNQAIWAHQTRRIQSEESLHINPLWTIGIAMAAGITAVRDRGHNVSAFAMGVLIGIAFRASHARGIRKAV